MATRSVIVRVSLPSLVGQVFGAAALTVRSLTKPVLVQAYYRDQFLDDLWGNRWALVTGGSWYLLPLPPGSTVGQAMDAAASGVNPWTRVLMGDLWLARYPR